MLNVTPIRDYEKLVAAELEAAARSVTMDERRNHLDQAGMYAALGEHIRGYALTGR